MIRPDRALASGPPGLLRQAGPHGPVIRGGASSVFPRLHQSFPPDGVSGDPRANHSTSTPGRWGISALLEAKVIAGRQTAVRHVRCRFRQGVRNSGVSDRGGARCRSTLSKRPISAMGSRDSARRGLGSSSRRRKGLFQRGWKARRVLLRVRRIGCGDGHRPAGQRDRGRGRSAYCRERHGRHQDHRPVDSRRSRRCREGGGRLPPTRGLSTGILTPFRTVPSGSRAVPLFGSGTLSGALWSGPKIRRTVGVPNARDSSIGEAGKVISLG